MQRHSKLRLAEVALTLLALIAESTCAQTTQEPASNRQSNEPAVTTPPYIYSDSSITGTYSILLIGSDRNGNYSQLIGSFKADGKGHVTGGALTLLGSADNDNLKSPCAVAFSGTYIAGKTASGTTTLLFKSSGSGDCTMAGFSETGTLHFHIQIAQQGVSLLFAESDGPYYGSGSGFAGTAIKQ